MRAFVALELQEPGIIDGLVGFQRELEKTGGDLKLVELENLHFTVKFLGEISDAQASEAAKRLQALKLPGASVTVKGVGAFPSPGNPNVIWVGVATEDVGKVRQIAEPVITALEGVGERDNRPFHAHLTVARVRTARNRSEVESLIQANSDRVFGNAKLSTLKLKSSVLTSMGARHSDLGVYLLR